VHANKRKRKALKDIEIEARYEAVQLGLWYIEMILLKHFEYKGEIDDRCQAAGNSSWE
jgi:hypothetical protein